MSSASVAAVSAGEVDGLRHSRACRPKTISSTSAATTMVDQIATSGACASSHPKNDITESVFIFSPYYGVMVTSLF